LLISLKSNDVIIFIWWCNGTVVGPAQSLWPWSVAWYRGNGDAPAGACYMMILMMLQRQL